MPDKHPAVLWERLEGDNVRCNLCGHHCVIASGKFGRCLVRQNVGGELQTLNYGPLVAINPDPIEKKPLFHFLPGTRSLSIAGPGCNFRCQFCQNWQISQTLFEGGQIAGEAVSPEQVVTAALNYDCASISYTYTEPTVFFEFAMDTARLAHHRGLKNCFVSNGYMTPLAVEMMAPHIDAINVDLKAFSDPTYRKVMQARLEPVLECLRAVVRHGIWLEVTTLVVPEMNDSPQELRDLARFIANELGKHVPWHVTRFHGAYHMTSAQTTPIQTLQMACDLGQQEGLMYVYCGNVTGQADERTYCPQCKQVVIDRTGYSIRGIAMKDGACGNCGRAIDGVWK